MKAILICLSLLCSATLWSNAQPCNQFILSINGQNSGSTITKSQLAEADSLAFNILECNQLLRVYTFELYASEVHYQANGNKFSKEMKAAFRKLKVGNTLYFERIKTRDRDNPEQIRLVSNQTVKVIAQG
jgi:hypothetical protein